MIKVDLITGFLGSGKTTFMKKYAEYLIEKGMNIGILENDHGAVNVDMMLLHDLEGEHCELEMIAGGCPPGSLTWMNFLTHCMRNRWINGMRSAT